MMIAFFNPKDTKQADLYSGEYPFVHWAEPISIGLVRYKELFFCADFEIAKIKFEDWNNSDWTFALFHPIATEDTDYDGQTWASLTNNAKGALVIEGQKFGSYYYYHMIILCRSDVEGEFIETFYINNIPYRVGAEFWGENESVRINLANQGTEIPEIVDKAIYGINVYEDGTDWVTVNRKFRELLIHHMEVLDNKGSYKSLERSLQWFEYGNLAELYEVWKYKTPDGDKYFDNPIGKMVSDDLTTRMFNSSKTTYFYLRSRKKILDDAADDAEFINTAYDNDDELDSDRVLRGLSCKWSEEEMRLKMCLLENFLETYFMPIHTEIFHSVVEDVSAHLIYMGWGSNDLVFNECYTEANDFDLDWDSNQEDEQQNGSLSSATYHLDEVHVTAGVARSEAYGQALENDGTVLLSSGPYAGLEYAPIIACHLVDDADSISGDATEDEVAAALEQSLGQVYNGIGAVLTGKFSFPENIVAGSVECNQWGEWVTTSFTEDNPSNSFVINFLFPIAGSFMMSFRFQGESGKWYTKVSNITINDNVRIDLNYFALVAATDFNVITPNPFAANPAALYMFTRTSELHDHTVEQLESGYQVFLEDMENNDSVHYSTYIPIRTSSDKSTHWQAPYLTHMKTYQWVGTGASDALTKFRSINKIALRSCWYASNDDDTANTYIRLVPKRRGAPLPTFRNPSLVLTCTQKTFESDVFFPEVHKLVSVPARVGVDIPIVCQPVVKLELNSSNQQIEKIVPYSRVETLETPSWEFYSYSMIQNIQTLSDSILEPYISWPYSESLPIGFYKVTFRYKYGNQLKTVVSTPSWKLVNEHVTIDYAQYVWS